LGRYARREQRLAGPDALEWPKALLQRGAVSVPPQQRGKRRRVGITRGASVATHEGGKNQRLKTAQQGLLAVMSQGKVVTRMRLLMGLYGLRELGENRLTGPLVIEPLGTERPAHREHTGPHLDDLSPRGRRPTAWSLARAALGPMELPPAPQAMPLAHTDVHGRMTLGDLVEQEPTRALRVGMKQGPPPGLLNVTELAACTKGWT
jgi:hypothetical protein